MTTGSSIKCPTCRGKGSVVTSTTRTRCIMCRGSGRHTCSFRRKGPPPEPYLYDTGDYWQCEGCGRRSEFMRMHGKYLS